MARRQSAGRTAKAGYAIEPRPSRFCQGSQALEAIMGQDRHGVSGDDLAQATWTIIHTAQALPPEDKLFRPRWSASCESMPVKSMPTKQHPLLVADAAGRLAVALRVEQIKQLLPQQVRADPSAAVFPGAVPAGTRRMHRSVSVDTSIRGWHSTGLYAPAGETITASVPAKARPRVVIRIGCHTDLLWDKDKWDRCPEITVHKPLLGETMVASPFGGPIYVEVGKPAGDGERDDCRRRGGPLFHPGPNQACPVAALRTAPAPWAELATSKVILSVPSEVVRRLDDPVALLEYWDRVLDCDAELAGIPSQRAGPSAMCPTCRFRRATCTRATRS